MKNIRRNHAIEMFARLEQMEIGKFDEATLSATMSNISALRKINDDFESLKNELFKRLYGDIEQMSDEKRGEIYGFFEMLSKLGRSTGEEALELDKNCKETYPELYETRLKEMSVLMALLNKEVEADIQEVDEDAFIKGVIKGKDDASVVEVREVFAPLFKAVEKTETDMSELDELLK